MKSRMLTCAVALWAAFGGVAVAEGPVVVELFTSQGCSSCPPAESIMGEIANRDDVIALSLHVDYWDYIGWKDIFAKPEFTKRQRAYARALGQRSVYTPQMVVGGTDHLIGSKPMKLAEQIERHIDAPKAVGVKLTRTGERVQIVATARGPVPTGMVVQLVTYTPEARVEIKRGENAGRTLNHYNIARDWVVVGTWDGRSDYTGAVRVPASTPVVVLVQEKNAGAILGAERLR